MRYHFGPLERRGLVAGWRGGQIATVASGLVVAVLVLRADSSVTGAIAALAVVGVAVAAATWPVGGRTLEEWAPDAVRYATGAKRRRGTRSDPFATLQLLGVEVGTPGDGVSVPRQVGVVVDDAIRSYTAVMRASDAGFMLLGEEEKVQRVSAWAGVLSSMALDGSSVRRVQWVARNVPDARGAFIDRAGASRAAVEGDGAARNSYAALLEAESAACGHREVLLALGIRAGRAARSVKAAGGEAGACALVVREAAALRRRLADAGIGAGDVLGPEELAHSLRRALESGISTEAGHARSRASCSGSRAAAGETWEGARNTVPIDGDSRRAEGRSRHRHLWPWPMGVQSEWDRVLVDDSWHATYWISEWPRTDVGPDFLGPLLLMGEVRCAVSVVMEPLGPIQAARKIEQARTADIADSELRRRGGFLATARRRREQEVLVQRETELADGHAPFRFSGYVSVSASDLEGLEEARGKVEQAAARCGLELRLCHGDQARALLSTLPLTRGLS